MGSPVVHFEIMGRNAETLKKFYSQLFNWQIQWMDEIKYGMVQAQKEQSIGGGIGQIQDGSEPYTVFYIEVDDPQAYLDKALGMGAKIVTPVTVYPGMVTFATFRDPEGNLIGLVKSEPQP